MLGVLVSTYMVIGKVEQVEVDLVTAPGHSEEPPGVLNCQVFGGT